MRAIIIDDKDAKSLIDKLKLAEFEKSVSWCVRQENMTDPGAICEEAYRNAHHWFLYHVVMWLQEQGARIS